MNDETEKKENFILGGLFFLQTLYNAVWIIKIFCAKGLYPMQLKYWLSECISFLINHDKKRASWIILYMEKVILKMNIFSLEMPHFLARFETWLFLSSVGNQVGDGSTQLPRLHHIEFSGIVSSQLEKYNMSVLFVLAILFIGKARQIYNGM